MKPTANLKIELENKKGAFYGRVSTTEQDIQMQEDSYRNFISKYNCEIIAEYKEELSATRNPLIRRKELMKLIKDARDNKYDFILVYNHDRLARNPMEHLKLRKWFNEINIPVYLSSSENLYSYKDILSNAIRDNYSKIEADNIRVRMKDSILSRISHGKWTGGHTPYAVEYVPVSPEQPDNKKLQYVTSKIDVVVKIFGMYKEGWGFSSIAKELNNKKLDPEINWTKDRIRFIITNPIYCGYLSIYKRKPNSTNSTTERSVWKMEKAEDLKSVEPIISREEWEYCYELYRKRKTKEYKNPRQFTTNYLLKDLIRCQHCSEPLKAKNQVSQGYGDRIYYCSGDEKKPPRPCGVRVIADDLDQHVFKYINNSILLKTANFTLFNDLQKEVMEHYNRRLFELKNKSNSLQIRIAEYQHDQLKAEQELKPLLLAQSERDTSAIETLQMFQAVLSANISETRNELETVAAEITRLEDLELKSETWKDILTRTTPLKPKSVQQIRHLLFFLIDELTIDRSGCISIRSRIDLESH